MRETSINYPQIPYNSYKPNISDNLTRNWKSEKIVKFFHFFIIIGKKSWIPLNTQTVHIVQEIAFSDDQQKVPQHPTFKTHEIPEIPKTSHHNELPFPHQ